MTFELKNNCLVCSLTQLCMFTLTRHHLLYLYREEFETIFQSLNVTGYDNSASLLTFYSFLLPFFVKIRFISDCWLERFKCVWFTSSLGQLFENSVFWLLGQIMYDSECWYSQLALLSIHQSFINNLSQWIWSKVAAYHRFCCYNLKENKANQHWRTAHPLTPFSVVLHSSAFWKYRKIFLTPSRCRQAACFPCC